LSDEFKTLIAKVATGATLSREESAAAFDRMMSGEATPSQMGGFLMGLRIRGETVDEITGAVSTMRAKMQRVAAPPDAIDVVGTGGDASGSYNISTCAAFIVAGAGIPVAKHGNRALSSRSGAADVLGALGVRIDLRPDEITRCIYEAGIGFMFAPAHHPATKNVAATRVEDVEEAIRTARPGTSLTVTYRHRGRGQPINAMISVIADPRLDIVPAEQVGQALTEAQRRFRDLWLRSRAGNTF